VTFAFDPSNLDTEAGGKSPEENGFVSPSITIVGCGAETRPDRYPQFSSRPNFLDIARAAFGGTARETRKGGHDRPDQDRSSALHTFTLLRT
jgi:hypothetical protein